MNARRAILERAIRMPSRLAIAVSGGVDSLTLAAFAQRARSDAVVEVFHAVSPAVPPEATDLVRRLATAEGWDLQVINAGEFDDPAYTSNPLNRCFTCKSHLYGAIASRTDSAVVSGTNVDDIGEFRPGLIAAEKFGVGHPYVEAGIGKAEIRSMARELGLGDVADLPAAPCLASRIETGIPIDPQILLAVNRVERGLRSMVSPSAVRCRLRDRGVVIELDDDTLRILTDQRRELIERWVEREWPESGTAVVIERYVRGSAFVGVSHSSDRPE
ncbi:adenine nucleotide alpha hydrolase [Nocardia sp. NPDC050713]|uniref:adenine nucleotide alpha hydrolase n=1 Tax=Nocardia sp. NPDC050713 TaxID=3154511 RepID=UPI0033C618EA